MAQLKEEAEKCKMSLSEAEAYHILVPAICVINGKPVELDETITVVRQIICSC